MVAQLPLNRLYKWRVSAVMTILVLMSFACNQTQDNTQPPPDSSEALPDSSQALSDNTELASGYTGLEHSEDVDVPTDDIQAPSDSVEVSVDGKQAPPEDLQVDFDYIKWMIENPAALQAPPGDPQVNFDYLQWLFENPAAQFVGLWSPDGISYVVNDDERVGFLWIEYPCVYLRDIYPIPLDIQAVADLDLDLEKAASEIASWPPPLSGDPLSSWVPADVQVVYESEPAHRILLRLPRKPSTFYDQATGKLWTGRWGRGSHVSGDLVSVETRVLPLSGEYRSLGCDARAELVSVLTPPWVSAPGGYSEWR